MEVYKDLSKQAYQNILKRPLEDSFRLEATVSTILEKVKNKGDLALKEFTEKFDGVQLDTLKVSDDEINEAATKISDELKEALQIAKENIATFHQRQKSHPSIIETMPGVTCWQKSVGIEKIGLYIPGGSAPLFSTVLMLGVPAQIAQCKTVVLCTPPQKNGQINPAILYAAKICGITNIYKIGGAQAIAAMAFGTESVPNVYKIFGPGNQYVTAAKQLVNRAGIAIDMPAGPSEVLVVADETADPSFIAADLLSQAEHGPDSQVVLVALNESIVEQTLKEIASQLQLLPRKTIAQKALSKSIAIITDTENEALDIINEYAPEHLIIALKNAEEFAKKITNAGSVFIGHFTPESVGDYASGTNHTLPTNGFAKAYSGLNLDAFVKKITYQKLTKEGLQNIGKTVEVMATAEQLMAHKNAVSIRLDKLNKSTLS